MSSRDYFRGDYILLGHGCDLTDETGNPEVVFPNEGCVYITTTSCGTTAGADVWGETVYKLQTTENTLQKEVDAFNKSRPADERYHICDGKIKKEFINNKFTPMVDAAAYKDGEFMLFRSGLIPVDYIKNQEKGIVYEHPDIPGYYTAIMFDYNPMTNEIIQYAEKENRYRDIVNPVEQLIKMAYSGSVYPSIEEVMRVFNKYQIDAEPIPEEKKRKFIRFKEEVKNTFKIKITDLFEQFPGTYFNTSCRVICGSENNEGINPRLVKLRRDYSITTAGKKTRRKYRKKTIKKHKKTNKNNKKKRTKKYRKK